MREAQSKSFQCTIPISVFEQSDLLLRYSTVTNLFEETHPMRPREYLNLPICPFQNATLVFKPKVIYPPMKILFKADTHHRQRPGSC